MATGTNGARANGAKRTRAASPKATAIESDGRTKTIERELSWQAPAIEANTIHKTLQRLWAELGEERREAIGKPRATVDGALMRTRTINLIAIADTTSEANRIKRIVTGLTEFFPSRTVILVRKASPPVQDGLAVTVAVEEHPTTKQAPVRFETITVSAAANREVLLASVASPVLVPELPDFVWCPSADFAESDLLQELLAITDRLIVDTSLSKDPARALRFLTTLDAGPHDGELHLSDSAWTRLTPWRQMIAQFFDQAVTQPCLDEIEEVTITYAEPDAAGRSGLTAGLLMAGWLCTRLGWRAPGEELVRSKDGWKLTLRAGAKGKSREVVLTLKSAKGDVAGHCLGMVELVAGGDTPDVFRVERVSDESVETTSELPSKVSRIVYLQNLDDARLLSLELRVFGSDSIYHQALEFAANLWPEGVAI